MRTPICHRGERAASMHAILKSAGGQRQSKGKDRVLISHSLEGESQESSVMGESMHPSGPEKRTSPLAESARGSISM